MASRARRAASRAWRSVEALRSARMRRERRAAPRGVPVSALGLPYVLRGCWRVGRARRLICSPALQAQRQARWRGEVHFLQVLHAARGLVCVPIGDIGSGPTLESLRPSLASFSAAMLRARVSDCCSDCCSRTRHARASRRTCQRSVCQSTGVAHVEIAAPQASLSRFRPGRQSDRCRVKGIALVTRSTT